jgi:hypothetical protein
MECTMRNFEERKKEKCHNRLTGILKIDINVLCKCIDNENQDYFKNSGTLDKIYRTS